MTILQFVFIAGFSLGILATIGVYMAGRMWGNRK